MRRHPTGFVNVGIREQLMTASRGLALTGAPAVPTLTPVMWPFVRADKWTSGSDAGAVWSRRGSYTPRPSLQHHSPRVPARNVDAGPCTSRPSDEVRALRAAALRRRRVYGAVAVENRRAYGTGPQLQVVRRGWAGAPVVVAVGPMLDPVLDAVADLDVTVAYTLTPRPLDTAGLRALVSRDVVVVEPYLRGTSSHLVAEALRDLPHRALHLGVGRDSGTTGSIATTEYAGRRAGLAGSIGAFLG